MKKSFGLPYMGSKNETAENIVSTFPRSRRLLDLFGGGASVTHAALVSGRFEQVVYNDLDPLIVDMLNRLKDEPLAPLRFVDRVEFKERYAVDPMVFFCWKYPGARPEYISALEQKSFMNLYSNYTKKGKRAALGSTIFKWHWQTRKAGPQTHWKL